MGRGLAMIYLPPPILLPPFNFLLRLRVLTPEAGLLSPSPQRGQTELLPDCRVGSIRCLGREPAVRTSRRQPSKHTPGLLASQSEPATEEEESNSLVSLLSGKWGLQSYVAVILPVWWCRITDAHAWISSILHTQHDARDSMQWLTYVYNGLSL